MTAAYPTARRLLESRGAASESAAVAALADAGGGATGIGVADGERRSDRLSTDGLTMRLLLEREDRPLVDVQWPLAARRHGGGADDANGRKHTITTCTAATRTAVGVQLGPAPSPLVLL